MTTLSSADDGRVAAAPPASTVGPLVVAAAASLGAGAIHAVAVGSHGEHRQAMIAFTVVAAFQLGWGGLALIRSSRLVAAIGGVGNALLLGGFALAKAAGIPMIDGLERAEGMQLADGAAAALAVVAVVAALVALASPIRRRLPPFGAAVAAFVVAALTLPSMVSAGTHRHVDGEDEHAHGTEVAADHGHATAIVPPRAYDPTLPIDLSGVAGVSPQQQARAENLIAITLARLPQFRDTAAAEAAGFRSIGDAAHRLRALHQLDLHRRRPGARPGSPGVAGVPGLPRRPSRVAGGDVHAQQHRHPRDRSRPRWAADPVAHPRQPLLHR